MKKSGYTDKTVNVDVKAAQAFSVTILKPGESNTPENGTVSGGHQMQSVYDVFHYNGHYYKLFDSNCDTWDAAKAYCEKLHGHLATVTTSAEDTALFRYIIENSHTNAYFGFTDAAIEGTWKWVTGEATSYTNWASGEPNDINGEDYGMYFWKFGNGQWNGHGTEADEKVYLCEWDSKEDYQKGLQILIAAEKKGQPAPTAADSDDGVITRSHLVPGSEALMMVLKGTPEDYRICADDLLYIEQTTVNEDGEALFGYYADSDDNESVSVIFGSCAHADAQWEVSIMPTEDEPGLKVLVCPYSIRLLKRMI